MRPIIALAGACTLLAVVTASEALAQGRGGGRGSGNPAGMSRGLDRADVVAGRHGAPGRNVARTRGSNAMGFCPPGQRKKAGRGSRFQC
jgi:hypothetical protein